MSVRLKCCGRTDPIGVDRDGLWLTIETDGNETIHSCQIRIAESIENLKAAHYTEVIDSGSDLYAAVYPQKELLREKTRYYWEAEVKTEQGTQITEPASFETGLESWSADWITGASSGKNVQSFRKDFLVQGKITDARLYICGLGYYNAALNGKALDDRYYKPLMTDYGRRHHEDNEFLCDAANYRVTYDTYDVTECLRHGSNALTVDIANGYYCNTDRITEEPDFSYGRARLIFELHYTEDGQRKGIVSDPSTQTRVLGCESTLYEGDRIDFTKEQAPFTESRIAAAPGGKLICPQCEADRVKAVYQPLSEKQTDGGTLYDFGINHTGGLHIRIEAKAGDVLHIRYAEVLDENGNPNFETSAWHDKNKYTGQMRDVYQENRYILKEGMNEITPLFSWYCYRYVLIEKPGHAKIHTLESLFICMDVPENGAFSCSEESFNRLNRMFVQTLRCNMHSGLMTDCPHREKRPYTGDGHLIMKAAYYHLDMTAFFRKWLEDIVDSQSPEGRIPNTAPDLGGGGGYAWGNAVCYVTKYLYAFTGDIAVVKKSYGAILRWLSYYEKHRDADHIIRSNGHDWLLGDWLAPEMIASDVYYINTVAYLQAAEIAAELAEIVEPNRVEALKTLSAAIKEGIHRVFFHAETASYSNGVQGEDVLALAAGIVPEEWLEAVRKRVEHHYKEETDYHLDTGIILTPVLIAYLTNHGYRDIAYGIMTAKTYPSYHTLMENDTTFPEHWSKKWPDYRLGNNTSKLIPGGGDVSHCHPMYGSVAAWLYERVAGLDLTGLHEKKVRICPYFTEYLSWAKAEKEVFCGKVSVSWERTEDGLTLEVRIPAGLTGEVCFPADDLEIVNCATEESWKREDDGCFRFALPAGSWRLMTKENSV